MALFHGREKVPYFFNEFSRCTQRHLVFVYYVGIRKSKKIMSQNFDEITIKYDIMEPPAGLYDKVLSRLNQERKILAVKKKLVIFTGFFVIFAVASFPAWSAIFADFTRSGFGQYLTLLFYDSRTVAAYWQDYSLSLLETLPAASLDAGLGLLFLALLSLRAAVRYSQILFQLSHQKTLLR
jgi:hypothetical protein